MHFQFPEETQQMQGTLRRFMDTEVLPRNDDFERIAVTGADPTDVVEPLKRKAREAGLWNLFLPALRDEEPGTRLTDLQYARLAEIIGRIPWAFEVFNCNAPDTGNMELLYLWSWGRDMRFLDGPDEVHLRSVARAELARARENPGSTAVHYRKAL